MPEGASHDVSVNVGVGGQSSDSTSSASGSEDALLMEGGL